MVYCQKNIDRKDMKWIINSCESHMVVHEIVYSYYATSTWSRKCAQCVRKYTGNPFRCVINRRQSLPTVSSGNLRYFIIHKHETHGKPMAALESPLIHRVGELGQGREAALTWFLTKTKSDAHVFSIIEWSYIEDKLRMRKLRLF